MPIDASDFGFWVADFGFAASDRSAYLKQFCCPGSVLLALLVMLLAGCLGATSETCLPASAEEGRPVYLVRHAWHAGVVTGPNGVPAAQDFPEATQFEIGWGDSAYYQAPDPGLGTTLKAALWPTPSVLHVVGLRQSATQTFPASEIIRVELSEKGHAALAAYLRTAFEPSADKRVVPLGPGLYGRSRFYRARGRYHLFHNCNHWVAQALRKAGCPITPASTLTVSALMRQARRFGTVVQSPDAAR